LPPNDDHPHVPGPSLWPAGFAVGIVVLLVGLVVSWYVVGIGAIVAIAFAFAWVRDLTAGTELAHAPEVQPEYAAGPVLPTTVGETGAALHPDERYPRAKFLELSTLGLGGVIGGLVTVPALGFMVAPAFLKQGVKDTDLGPISEFPEGKYVVTTFTSNEKEGTVSRRTAYIRYNGDASNSQPSFTIISNHCAHLGCPVQPNGPLDQKGASEYHDVALIPTVSIAGFGCPCHGGQYDNEGNRIAGPPVRALDRYAFSIRNGNLFVGKPYSVSHVDGAGATAIVHKWTYSFPGEHVNGIESWLYPVQPPH
jgi:menaquinol-cytochrome c reductase iron-sulfur subunit